MEFSGFSLKYMINYIYVNVTLFICIVEFRECVTPEPKLGAGSTVKVKALPPILFVFPILLLETQSSTSKSEL